MSENGGVLILPFLKGAPRSYEGGIYLSQNPPARVLATSFWERRNLKSGLSSVFCCLMSTPLLYFSHALQLHPI